MRRTNQTFEQLQQSLSEVKSSSLDPFGQRVIDFIHSLQEKQHYSLKDIQSLLTKDFDLAITIFRLVLGKSKDEFNVACRLKSNLRLCLRNFEEKPTEFLQLMEAINVPGALTHEVNRPVTWRNILEERLIGGRGRALKGQSRGRFLEDAVEAKIKPIFKNYDVRCRFIGKSGISTEKTDFAIPSRKDPRILIEVKAYGATGSKQTDILGDLSRIVENKRHDTDLILVTDGLTWLDRSNDLRKIVAMQNKGYILKIYTQKMIGEFKEDLTQLKKEHDL